MPTTKTTAAILYILVIAVSATVSLPFSTHCSFRYCYIIVIIANFFHIEQGFFAEKELPGKDGSPAI